MSASILQSQKLSLYSDKHLVIRDIELEVNDVGWIELIGENKTGKSLFLKSLYGSHSEITGILKVLDFSLNPISVADKSLLRRKIGYVSQIPELLPDKTVRVNLSLALTAAEKFKDQATDELIKQTLSLLELDALIKREVYTLSLSEQHMVALARAVIHKPRLILIDSIFQNWGDYFQKLALELLEQLILKDKTTVILTDSKTIKREMPNKSIYYIKDNLLNLMASSS